MRRFDPYPPELVGRGRPVALPIEDTLPAAPFAGAQVFGADGKMYFSDGSTWIRSLLDGDAVPVQDGPEEITVGPGGDFPDLDRALEFAGNRLPKFVNGVRNRTDVRILSGHIIRAPVDLREVDLGHVTLWADDTTVLCDMTACFPDADPYPIYFIDRWVLLHVDGGVAPTVRMKFVMFNPRPGQGYIGMRVKRGGRALFRGAQEDLAPVPIASGFVGFDVNLSVNGSSVSGVFVDFLDARRSGISLIDCFPSTFYAIAVTGSAVRSLEVFGRSDCTFITQPTYPDIGGIARGDFRRSPGIDSNNDIWLASDASAHIEFRATGGIAPLLGGYNIAPNTIQRGNLLKIGSQALRFDGELFADAYTLGTLPVPEERRVVLVMDGDAGQPCLAVSISNEWRRIPIGPAVSLT